MKRLAILVLLLPCSLFCYAQRIVNIVVKTTPDKSFIKSIELIADKVIVEVDLKGGIILYPAAHHQLDYWTSFDGDYRQGKLKSIDNTMIDYYDQFVDDKIKTGRLKSIGKNNIVYFDKYDGPENIGRIKSIGGIAFTYYDQFDGFDNIGKLKSVGNISISYFDRFDRNEAVGKLKSIGNATIIYFGKTDIPEDAGKIKTISGKVAHTQITIAE